MAAANWAAKIISSDIVIGSIKKADNYDTSNLSGTCYDAKFILFPAPINLASVTNMAVKRPLCLYDGIPKELSTTDTLPGYTLVSREVPSGTKNSSNVIFSLANVPILGSEQVYVNGLLQYDGSGNDYTISGLTITFTVAPSSTDIILVTYWR